MSTLVVLSDKYRKLPPLHPVALMRMRPDTELHDQRLEGYKESPMTPIPSVAFGMTSMLCIGAPEKVKNVANVSIHVSCSANQCGQA